MKKYIKPLLSFLVCYIVLLIILVAVESNAPNASIRSFWDAVWYSIITSTTIGYGDLVPVTTIGRVLGILFAIFSIGVLTSFIAISLKIITGELMPSIYMYRKRNDIWHVFNEENDESVILINDLLATEKDSLIIVNSSTTKEHVESRIIYSNMSYQDIIEKKKGKFDGLDMFFLGDNELENYSNAKEIAKCGIETYCKSNGVTELDTEHINLINVPDCISRTYWKNYPLTKERNVVIIGCGDIGCALLEKALITNVTEKNRVTEYHVFGDKSRFVTSHKTIVDALSVPDNHEDYLCFHHEDWREGGKILSAADRIIICENDELKNILIYQSLTQWYPVQAPIHLFSSQSFPHASVFGGSKEIFTKQIVMKDELNRCAELLNDIYNQSSDNPVEWKDLSPFLRQSNIAAADHLIVKIRYLLNDDSQLEVTEENCEKAYNEYCSRKEKDADLFQEMEHRRWVRFHQLYNWTSGDIKSFALREHPCLVPYSELKEQDKQKDAYSWELLGSLANELKKRGGSLSLPN